MMRWGVITLMVMSALCMRGEYGQVDAFAWRLFAGRYVGMGRLMICGVVVVCDDPCSS